MKQQDAFALGQSKLNNFLFADIGVERSGMPLSVISALARQGFDPWLEAGRLAKLPRKSAIEGLARLIASMPASLWPLSDATAIAARLVALLPGESDRPVADSSGADSSGAHALSFSPATRAALDLRQGGPWIYVALLVMALLAGLSAYVGAPASTGPSTSLPAHVAPANSVPTGS